MFTCTLEHPVIGLDDVTSDHESSDSKILTRLICWTLGKVAAELPRQSIVKYCGIFATVVSLRSWGFMARFIKNFNWRCLDVWVGGVGGGRMETT